MNKVKMFFVAAALVLTTAGVFAGKARFTGNIPQNLYYFNTATSAYGIVTGTALSTNAVLEYGVQNGTIAKLSGATGTQYALYNFTAPSTYAPVYNVAW